MDSFEPRNTEMDRAEYGLSWTAYIRPAVLALILGLFGWMLASISAKITFVLLATAGLYLAYNILFQRSVRLITDAEGVWLYGGILPWAKGMSGVKWRDIDDAGFFPGFFGWLFKSYRVRIGHRYTKTSEIIVRHLQRGNEVAERINQLHRRYLENAGNRAE
jgi:hypothetical protein